MKTKLSKSTKLAIIVILIAGLMNIILGYLYSNSVNDNSEFAAIRVAAVGISSILIIGISTIAMLSTISLLKGKRWALILNIVLMVLIFPILSICTLEELAENTLLIDLIFTIKLSLPPLVIVFLIMGRKDFLLKKN